MTDWLEESYNNRLLSLEEKVTRLQQLTEEAGKLAKENKSDLSEILYMFKLQRWLLRMAFVVVGFGMWLTGKISFDQISSVVGILNESNK